MELHEYIKELRLSKKIKGNELAKVTGYSQSHISGIENGLKKINNRFLNKYIKAVSKNSAEYDVVKKDIEKKFNINLHDVEDINFLVKENSSVSLNIVTDTKLEIDGIELSVSERKLILSVIRGYREL